MADDAARPSLSPADRAWFDALVDEVVEALPVPVAAMLADMAVVVIDEPDDAMLTDLGVPPDEWAAARLETCGLHTGVAETEWSVEHSGVLPSQIHLFRMGLSELVGGIEAARSEAEVELELREEIRVTLLHEIGHQAGLDEDDLDALGYG